MTFYDTLLAVIFGSAVITFLALSFIDAPYGRTDDSGWGPGVPVRIGWMLLELPSLLCFTGFFLMGEHAGEGVTWLLFGLWFVHYFHRSFIYPLEIKAKPKQRMVIVMLLIGVGFNAVNGGLNGYYLSNFGVHLYTDDAWSSLRLMFGVALFIAGFGITKHSDALLRNLRKPGETDYKIPKGGLFKWLSCPNYFGEVLQWAGFAVACWSLPALAFALYTAANLVPRALSHHAWYISQFHDYPTTRKAVFPGVL